MRTRISLLAGLLTLSLGVSLVGCDPNKDKGAAPASGDTAAPAPTAGAPAPANAASSPFNKPIKATGALTIKVITNGNSPFWDSMGKGLEVGLKETGSTGNWSAPAQADNNSQKDTFDQDVAANADGIGVSVIDAKAFVPVIDSAISKGIPVITFDSDAPDSKRLAYIGTDNYDAGKKAGEAAVKLFPNGGNIIAFVGNMSADNAKARYNGFVDATKDHKIVALQDPYEDNKDATGAAHRNVADAITKYGAKINGLVGLYSYNGPAIVDEVKKANLLGKIKIICFDGEPKTLENLQKNLVDITVVQKPYEFGRLTAKLLTGINRKGLDAALDEMKPELEKAGMKIDMTKHIIDTGVEVVTPANAQEFLKELNAKGLKST